MKIRLIAAACCCAVSVWADIRLPQFFSDNMILQQQTQNAIWGRADAGEAVTVKASWGAKVSGKADKDGKWKVFLETPRFGTGYSLTVSGKNKIEIKNVAIGEVWLCTGQSNMGWGLNGTFAAETSIPDANDPDFRFYKTFSETSDTPLEFSNDRLGRWKVCSPETAGSLAAVAFHFGQTLHRELGIPVGLLWQAYAGTHIEGWMPKELQLDDPRVVAMIQELEAKEKTVLKRLKTTREKELATYKKEMEEYNRLIDQGDTVVQVSKYRRRDRRPPKIPQALTTGGFAGIGTTYNGLVAPIIGYGMRGVIWYQGERNSKTMAKSEHYREQLPMLIEHYRSIWNQESGGNTDPNFAFQTTQLPSWGPLQTEPDEGVKAPWAVNREMMRLVANEVPNTEVAISIDTGDSVLLHPKNKMPIGQRHAYLALKNTYGKNITGQGPMYKDSQVKGGRIILNFEEVGSGLMAAKPAPLNSFVIAGADQKWHWADAVIKGNAVEVSSPEVSHPKAVRYAWAMNPSQRNLLYNKEGFPASPFRTDAWPLYNPDDEPVEVFKPAKPDGYEAADWERPVMMPSSK